MDAGWILYDVFDLSRPGDSTDEARVSVFHAKIEGGVLTVPPYEDDFLVRKGVSV
jgi:CRISPR-associated protein Cas5d